MTGPVIRANPTFDQFTRITSKLSPLGDFTSLRFYDARVPEQIALPAFTIVADSPAALRELADVARAAADQLDEGLADLENLQAMGVMAQRELVADIEARLMLPADMLRRTLQTLNKGERPAAATADRSEPTPSERTTP